MSSAKDRRQLREKARAERKARLDARRRKKRDARGAETVEAEAEAPADTAVEDEKPARDSRRRSKRSAKREAAPAPTEAPEDDLKARAREEREERLRKRDERKRKRRSKKRAVEPKAEPAETADEEEPAEEPKRESRRSRRKSRKQPASAKSARPTAAERRKARAESRRSKRAKKEPEPTPAPEEEDEPPPAYGADDPDEAPPAYMAADPDEEPAYMMADPDEEPSYMMADPDEEPAYITADPDEEPAYASADPDEPAAAEEAVAAAVPADTGPEAGLVAGAPATDPAKTKKRKKPRVLAVGDLKLGERAFPEGDTAAAYDFYTKIIRSVGEVHEQPFQINCLGLKHFRKGERVGPSVSAYTDTVVLLYRDGDGNPHVEEFAARLDPPPACWNDGKRSRHLCDGYYEFALGTWHNLPTLVQSGAVSSWRDPDPYRPRRDDPIVETGQCGMCLRWGDDPEQPPETPEGHQLLRGGRNSANWTHFIKTALLDKDQKVPYTVIDSSRLLKSGGASTTIVGTPPGYGPAAAAFDDPGGLGEASLASDIAGTDRTWQKLPADPWRESYPELELGSDFADDYLAVLHACRRSSAPLIVGSAHRSHITQVASDTSPTSLHYVGRALDLCPQAGVLDDDLPYVLVKDGADHRGRPYGRVYARAAEGAPRVERRTLTSVRLVNDTWEEVEVEGFFLDLTALLAASGFARCAAREGWEEEPGLWHWWHFHNLKGLVPGRTTFGMEMLRFPGVGPELLLEWGLGPYLKARWKVEWWG